MSNGRTVSQIVEGNRRFDVVMRLSDQDRSTTGLGDLLIATPTGHVPLRMIADGRGDGRAEPGPARERPAPDRRARQHATAGATWRRSSPTSAASSPRRSWPQGYVTRLEGTFQAQEEATLRIGALSLVSLAMVFVVLYSRYQSPALALIIMGNIPLALIGSVIALNIAGQPLSVASMIGFITLAGISARNGILKVIALHQPRPLRRRAVRARPRDPRQPGAADARC